MITPSDVPEENSKSTKESMKRPLVPVIYWHNLLRCGLLIAVSLALITEVHFIYFYEWPLAAGEKVLIKQSEELCRSVVYAIQKQRSLEGVRFERLTDLKEKYREGLESFNDPWGNSVLMDPLRGMVYSAGPDGLINLRNHADPVNLDNIQVPYIRDLVILQASIEVNPGMERNPDFARDVLHLRFNKQFMVRQTSFIINRISVPKDDPHLVVDDMVIAGKSKDQAAHNYSFRWSRNRPSQYRDGATILRHPLPDGTLAQGEADTREVVNLAFLDLLPRSSGPDLRRQGVWHGKLPGDYCSNDGHEPVTPSGGLYSSIDQMEAIIVLPMGSSGSILPDVDFVNLTGGVNRFTPATGQIFMEIDGLTAASMSTRPVKIERYSDQTGASE